MTHGATRTDDTSPVAPGWCGASRADDEAGESALTAIFGVGIFLGFLLLAAQVMLYLFTASVAQAAAVDGANYGAGAAQTASVSAAVRRTNDVLGGLADDAVVNAVVVADAAGTGRGAVVRVTVRVSSPAITGRFGLTDVRREATARLER